MNGRDLALGVVGALAVGAALRRRGSRSAPLATVLQEEVQPGFWVRVRRTPDGRHLQALLLLTPHAIVYDEEDNEVYGFVLADDARVYPDVLPSCSAALDEARIYGVRGLYLVGNTALDEEFQGRGIGLAMYDALVRAAWKADQYAVSPHWCAPKGSVTSAAMRVWSKLARRYPHLGEPNYMRAEEDDHDPEALAEAGTPVIVWAGGGSTNRAPAPTDAALRALRTTMAKAARADTAFSAPKWKRAKDPLTGHCYAVAHVVRERFGGELVKGEVKGEVHAWNRLPGGREVDLSGSQYGGDGLHPLVRGEVVPWPKAVNPRFARFAARVARVQASGA